MPTEFQSVDDFLNHKGSEGYGLKNLKGWAKDPGYFNAWLHTKQMPTAVWLHRWPELVIRPNKESQGEYLKNIWGRQFGCHEDESTLKKQHRRNEGRREHPPTRCGLCRLIECVRGLLLDGELTDTDVLFKFEGSDKPDENCIRHAGGLANVWRSDKMKDEDKARLAKHGIYFSNQGSKPGAWSQNLFAKLNYVFCLVNNDAVQDGLQIDIQTEGLGKKVKNVIRDEIQSKDDLGNPFLNPYCIRFLYRAEEKKFDDKYHALRIDKFKMSPEVEKLIRSDKPDISRFTKKFNQKEMRTALEMHATPLGKQLPWAKIFDVPGYGEEEKPEPKAEAKQERTPEVTSKPAATPAAQEEMIPCDDCNTPLPASATKCHNCGAKYEDDGKPAPVATPAPAAKAASTEPAFGEGVYDGGDADVPF